MMKIQLMTLEDREKMYDIMSRAKDSDVRLFIKLSLKVADLEEAVVELQNNIIGEM